MNDYINFYQNIIVSHFSLFPIGLVILSNDIQTSGYIVSYINAFASGILPIHLGVNVSACKEVFTLFRKRELNYLSNVTLWDSLFNSNFTDCNETFFSDCYMVYIKIKFVNDIIYISIDNLNEQRKTLQEKMIQSISYQFLTSIAHEINNPLNSLISTIDEQSQLSLSCAKRLRLLVCLIKSVAQKLIVYSKSLFDALRAKEKHHSPVKTEIVNLSYIFAKLSRKFALLFDYKHIIIDNDYSLLQKCLFKCDRYYLKELIKNLWLYLYYQVPKDSKITIVSSIQNGDLVKMTFQHEGIKAQKFTEKCSDKKLISESEIMYDASVNTIEMCKDILLKIAAFLDVEVNFIEEDNVYLSLDFNNVIFDTNSSDTEEEVDEFNTPRKNNSLVPSFTPLKAFELLKNSKKSNPNALSSKNLSNYTKDIVQLSNPKRLINKSDVIAVKKQKMPSENDIKENARENNQYDMVCSNLGKSLARILAPMRDPVMDNIKSPLSPPTKPKTFKKGDDGINSTSKKTTMKEDDGFMLESASCYFTPLCSLKKNDVIRGSNAGLSGGLCQATPQPEANHKDILIVDDEDFNVKTLQNLLKQEKQVADICYNGFESIQYLKKHPNVKLVLMDICMPVMDGIEACKHIEEMVKSNQVNPNIVVIIVSAHPPDVIYSGNLQCTVVKDFFKKPLSRSKLKVILKEYNLV